MILSWYHSHESRQHYLEQRRPGEYVNLKPYNMRLTLFYIYMYVYMHGHFKWCWLSWRLDILSIIVCPFFRIPVLKCTFWLTILTMFFLWSVLYCIITVFNVLIVIRALSEMTKQRFPINLFGNHLDSNSNELCCWGCNSLLVSSFSDNCLAPNAWR